MTMEEISAVNQEILAAESSKMYDLEAMESSYDASALKDAFLATEIPERELYINGTAVKNAEYFGELLAAMRNTCYSGIREQQYAVCTTRANLRTWPTDDILGYSATDPDDELQDSAVLVNEPFIIRQSCVAGGKTFYWGYSNTYSGWVNAECFGLCQSRQEWLDAWKIDPEKADFLVVTQDKIFTEPAIQTPYSSNVRLTLGTILKLVPPERLNGNIGERYGWYNYAVYLPTRDANGKLVQQPCFIPKHEGVSIGFLPFTQKNLLDIAFSCLGDRYGWGGMLDSLDCSLYTRSLYRCFGFELPRDSTPQREFAARQLDVSQMSDKDKYKLFSTLPAGTLLYFKGHAMVYVGTVGEENYVISATGSVVDSEGGQDVKNVNSVILTPLSVRRGSGNTWLQDISEVVLVNQPLSVEDTIFALAYGKKNGKPEVSAYYHGMKVYEGVHYSVEYEDESIIITGLHQFAGSSKTLSLAADTPSFSSLTNEKGKKVKVEWESVPKGNGYEVQYSADENFKTDVKTVTIKKNTVTSTTLSKLTKQMTYYVRIRTIRTVDGKSYPSEWSKAMNILVEK